MDKKVIKYIIFTLFMINVCVLPVKALTVEKSNTISTVTIKEQITVQNEFKKKKNKKTEDDIEVVQLSTICSDKNVKKVFRAFGYAILISKIIVPIVLIVGTSLNFGKAVTASDEKGIKEATSKFAKSAIAALVIFFLPTIINLVLSLAEDSKYDTNDYVNCRKCLFEVKNCK